MKWGVLQPEVDAYDFEVADAVLAYAEDQGLIPHGHVLEWARINDHQGGSGPTWSPPTTRLPGWRS